jgi:hypothetical protein
LFSSSLILISPVSADYPVILHSLASEPSLVWFCHRDKSSNGAKVCQVLSIGISLHLFPFVQHAELFRQRGQTLRPVISVAHHHVAVDIDHVREHCGAFEHVVESQAVSLQDFSDILHRLLRLRLASNDASGHRRDQFAVD